MSQRIMSRFLLGLSVSALLVTVGVRSVRAQQTVAADNGGAPAGAEEVFARP